ncbi:MAG: decaprenyl-phosphate phosphoribosyltransferase [Ignavibacteria bacterium]|nr:decaprenyl-phosphate phosphoribosyltransferase [Ignavibacteria bacterium]
MIDRIMLYLQLIRPGQWVKNAFVLAPLIFSRELFDPGPLQDALLACAGFCLAAGAVYCINDLTDVAADRVHPVKRTRPLASGQVSAAEALMVAFFLLITGAVVTAGLGWVYLSVIGTYILLNILYSLKLKEVVLVDVFLVASGFMLRVLSGAVAIDVPVSSWIILCTLFISLFLGFGKRRGELTTAGGGETRNERKVLLRYSVGFLDQMLTISAAGAVITYALYTMAPSTLKIFSTDLVIYTTVFVIFGVSRYLFLIHSGKSTDNPTLTVTSDLPILITGIAWILVCVSLIYSHP